MDANASRPVGGSGHASGGTGWDDRPDAADVVDALVEKIGEQQRRVAASAKSGLDGRPDRGQHQKLLLGARGTLRIFDGLPDAVKKGPFATPFVRPVACRFSNGQPCPFSDREADVRGIALKVFTPAGVETDFLATNEGGRSHARSARPFMEFADVLVAQIENGVPGALRELTSEVLAGSLGPVEAAHMLGILTKEVLLHSTASLATERYWGSVVALGDAAIKYAVLPHDATPSGTQAAEKGDDYLREDLQNRLKQGPVRWRLCVQLFANEQETPVNDASVAWTGDLIPVGEIEIASPPAGADEARIDQMAFNPGNGFAPLGITHARQAVYAASALNRIGRGLLSSEEARRFLD